MNRLQSRQQLSEIDLVENPSTTYADAMMPRSTFHFIAGIHLTQKIAYCASVNPTDIVHSCRWRKFYAIGRGNL